MSGNTRVIKNYADVLLVHAGKKSQACIVLQEIRLFLTHLAANEQLHKLMCSPLVDRKKKIEILDILCAQSEASMNVTSKNFLRTVIKNKRMNLLSEIIFDAEYQLQQRSSIEQVEVISACTLTKKENLIVKDIVEKKLGKKINIKSIVDESILGGVIVKHGSQMMNYSIQGAMDKISKLLI